MEEQNPITHITPTVGRVVWYWPSAEATHMAGAGAPQPLRADICHVLEDGSLNLAINDANGVCWNGVGVKLHQGYAENCSLPRPFATWMPYQLEMALKQWISLDDDRRAAERQERFTKPDSESDTAELQRRMLAEQVRELRIMNDTREVTLQAMKANGFATGGAIGGGVQLCAQQRQQDA